MNRRTFFAVASMATLAMAGVDKAQAAGRLDAEQIKAGLRTASVEEEGFVGRVVELANKGTIPLSMVDSTFQWARRKPHYQFQYFKRAMIFRASKIGVSLE